VNKKPYEAGYKQPTWKHQDEPYQNIKQLFAEELQKVVFVTEGGVTKSTTKAAVIAAQWSTERWQAIELYCCCC
jgi:hypothetical protein